tara:strand:+ start:4549 stop:5052 length:504 start_codon:yes stop_codon:yes gene_type:complete
MEIIDNFLPDNNFYHIKNIITSQYFPWCYAPTLKNVETGEINELEHKETQNQFVHLFYNFDVPVTEYFQELKCFREKLEVKSLVRIKANLNPCVDKVLEHGYHIDLPDCTTAVYYLNTCEGYTKFETGEVVESVENRIVIFDSNIKHTGTTTTNPTGRFVINFNFFR